MRRANSSSDPHRRQYSCLRNHLCRLLAEAGVYGNLVPEAHLAALAIEHGLTLGSTDGDFARFAELKWVNPLLAP